MLEALRKGAGSLVAKIFIFLLVASFAVWGVADIFRGSAETSVARVGDTEVSIERYRQELREEIQALSRRSGTYLTMDQARALGIDSRVLSRLMAEAALDDEAARRNLHVPDEVVAAAIRNDPTFRAPGGQFDRSYFEQYIRATGYSEGAFVAEQRQQILRRAIGEAVGGAPAAPATLAAAFHRYVNEQRSADYVVVAPEQVGEVATPGEEELRAYYDERKAEFTAPEYRAVGIVTASPAEMAQNMEVPEAELEAAFEARRNQFATAERRRIDQITFDDLEAAQAAYAAIQDGKSFDEVASERGLQEQDVSLGLLTRDQVVDPSVAETAFSLEEGQVSEPVEGQFSPVIVRVSEIEGGTDPTLEEVAPQLREAIATERARDQVLDVYDQVEDDRASGMTLREIAEARGLSYREVQVDQSGRAPDGTQVELPQAQALLGGVFESDVGLETDPIDTEGDGFVWYAVEGITPSRQLEFEEARDAVTTALTRQRQEEMVRERAQALAERVRGGATLEEIAAELGTGVLSLGPVGRTQETGGFGEAALGLLFTTPQGEIAETTAAEPTQRVIFRVTDVTVPQYEAEPDGPIVQQLDSALANDFIGQYLSGLEGELGAAINQDALSLALGDTAG